MTNESDVLKEIHDIRLRIYEETRDLTPKQRAELTSRIVREFEQKSEVTFQRLEPTHSSQRKIYKM